MKESEKKEQDELMKKIFANGNLSGGNEGGVRKHNHSSKSRCPRPGCQGSGVSHCGICLEKYGIYVCGTNCQSHIAEGSLNWKISGDVVHLKKGEYGGSSKRSECVFNPKDREVINRGYVDAREIIEEAGE